MDNYLIYKIENFLDNISIDISTINDQLIKFENKESIWDSVEHMIYFNKSEFMYDCNKLEVFCRALRDKLYENEYEYINDDYDINTQKYGPDSDIDNWAEGVIEYL